MVKSLFSKRKPKPSRRETWRDQMYKSVYQDWQEREAWRKRMIGVFGEGRYRVARADTLQRLARLVDGAEGLEPFGSVTAIEERHRSYKEGVVFYVQALITREEDK